MESVRDARHIVFDEDEPFHHKIECLLPADGTTVKHISFIDRLQLCHWPIVTFVVVASWLERSMCRHHPHDRCSLHRIREEGRCPAQVPLPLMKSAGTVADADEHWAQVVGCSPSTGAARATTAAATRMTTFTRCCSNDDDIHKELRRGAAGGTKGTVVDERKEVDW